MGLGNSSGQGATMGAAIPKCVDVKTGCVGKRHEDSWWACARHTWALPETLRRSGFFLGSGDAAVQRVGSELVMHVEYEIRAATTNVISFVPQADKGGDSLVHKRAFLRLFCLLATLQDLTL